MEFNETLMGEVRMMQMITSQRYNWDNRIRPTRLPRVILQRVISGTCVFNCEGTQYEVTAGETFLFWWGDDSDYRYPRNAKEPLSIDYITITGPTAVGFAREIRNQTGSVFQMSKESRCRLYYDDLMSRLIGGAFFDRYHNAELTQALLFALLRMGRSQKHNADSLETAHDWILSNFTRPYVTKEVADKVGFSREHLTRKFTEKYGETPAAMTARLRLTHAQFLLEMGVNTVSDVARRCGYSNVDSFSRSYFRKYGYRPANEIKAY